ncbi:hypothetical protein BV25DRAFT_1916874 [Artomyces pyxidatus]|uniref:Uncharacterized protein n=1 Tax=Artomyces pyxidatus TaxID=48021 RepID=A0ACB8T029_9AGAM|nr:hypothetical protein BV25DRAFT_1916874 [Artomyces pyxidatus]
MARSLVSLAGDILLEILEMLQGRDTLACYATCCCLRTLIKHSLPSQYAIELFACGMLDGPDSLPTLERLERLHRHTAAWEKLLWTGRVPLPHLVGVRRPSGASGAMLLLPGEAPFETPAARLRMHVQQVPSELSGISERHYIVPSNLVVGGNYKVFLDMSQGLIASQELEYFSVFPKLCPLAVDRRGPCRRPVRDPGPMEISSIHDMRGDFLLETVHDCTAYTPISRNWKTGFIAATGISMARDGPFCFLNERHALSAMPSKPKDSQAACLRVTSLSPVDPDHNSVLEQPSLYVFELPESLQNCVTLVHMQTSALETAPRGYFYPDPDPADRLISISLSLHHRKRIIIDTLARTLLRCMAARPAGPGELHVRIPWEAWGTHGARLTADISWVREFALSGARRAFIRYPPAPDGAVTLTVLDYHPRRVARAIARGSATVLHGAEIGEEDTGAGAGPLRTVLPCIATDVPVSDVQALAGDGEVVAWLCDNGALLAKYDDDRDIGHAWAYTI